MWACDRRGVPDGGDRSDVLVTADQSRRGVPHDPSTHPLERAHEAVAVLFDAPLSEGTLAGLSVDAAERLAPFMTELAALIRSSAVVCADETSTKVGRSTSWVHTASTSELTLLAHHARRGIDAIIAIGVLPGYRGVIMHDGSPPTTVKNSAPPPTPNAPPISAATSPMSAPTSNTPPGPRRCAQCSTTPSSRPNEPPLPASTVYPNRSPRRSEPLGPV